MTRDEANAFSRYGIDPGEFGGALVEALRRGGAGEDEIREALTGIAVDAAMPEAAMPEEDGAGWRLDR